MGYSIVHPSLVQAEMHPQVLSESVVIRQRLRFPDQLLLTSSECRRYCGRQHDIVLHEKIAKISALFENRQTFSFHLMHKT